MNLHDDDDDEDVYEPLSHQPQFTSPVQHMYVLDRGDESETDHESVFYDEEDGEDLKFPYIYERRPISPVEIDELGSSEFSRKAQQLAKRLASSYSDECESLLRSSRKKDAKTVNYLQEAMARSHIRSPSPSSTRKTFHVDTHEETSHYRPMNGHRPREVTCKVSYEQEDTPRKSYWWREKDEAEREDEESKLSVREKRNRLEAKLDGILDYEVPMVKHYSLLKHSLRDVEDKMNKHRLLLNRYTGVDLDEKELSVEERVERRADRMLAKISHYSNAKPSKSSDLDEQQEIYNYSPSTTLGYTAGLTFKDGSQTSELRGRLRRLICRSKKNPHYYRY
jgi:hypothetical protein